MGQAAILLIRGKNTNATTYNRVPIGFVADAQSPAYTDWVQGRNDPYMLEPITATNLGTKNLGLPGDVIVTPGSACWTNPWTGPGPTRTISWSPTVWQT